MSDATERVPGVGRGVDPIGADPKHTHVDQPRQAQLRVREATQVYRTRRQGCDGSVVDEIVERTQPLRLRRRVLGMGCEQVDSLAGREHAGHLPVECRVIGVNDDVHLARCEHVVQPVVHGAAN